MDTVQLVIICLTVSLNVCAILSTVEKIAGRKGDKK